MSGITYHYENDERVIVGMYAKDVFPDFEGTWDEILAARDMYMALLGYRKVMTFRVEDIPKGWTFDQYYNMLKQGIAITK